MLIPFYAYFSTSKLIQNDDTVNYLMRGYYTNKYDVNHKSEENLYIFDIYVAQKHLWDEVNGRSDLGTPHWLSDTPEQRLLKS